MDNSIEKTNPKIVNSTEKLNPTEKRRVRVTNTITENTPISAVHLAKISHELRTFLNSITGIAQVLQHNKQLSQEEMREYINGIFETCNDLITLTNDILDFTSLEHDQLNIPVTAINLQQTIEQTINQYILRAEHKKLTLNINYTPNAPLFVLGNAARVRQILCHLLDNALKFTQQGSITVSLKQTSNTASGIQYAQITVKDTGIGIPTEQLPYIFSQLPLTMHAENKQFIYKYPGIGLGLIIVKQLITRMGGEISVNSEAGKGSEFTFTLPITDETNAEHEMIDLRQQIKDLRTLIICDDSSKSESLREQLSLWELNCTTSNVNDAVIVLRKAIEDKLPFQIAIVSASIIDQHTAYFARSIRANAIFTNLVLLFAPSTDLQNYEIDQALASGYTTVLPYLQPTLFMKELAQAWTTWPHKIPLSVAEIPIKKTQVLVVEDNQINQKVAKLLLAALNCQVDIVENGQLALQRFQKNRYDIVFMDIGLPDISGLEVTLNLRNQENSKSHIPVIALTAESGLQSEDTWKQMGIDDYLIKPYTMEQLEKVMQKWVKK